MKILWLSATPCNAQKYFKQGDTIGGGWLISLEEVLKRNNSVDLHVAFYSKIKSDNFTFENVHYYPIYDKLQHNKIQRLYTRIFCRNNTAEKISKIIEIVNIVNPDIIHVHGSEADYGLIELYTKKPVVISIQGILSPYLDKYFSGINPEIFKRNETLYSKFTGNSIHKKYTNMLRRSHTEKRILSNAKYIFGRTEWDKQITYLFNSKRKYFISNEILRNPFYKKKWEKENFNSIFQIVTVISNGPYKGGETLIKAASLLEEFSTIQFKWIIIGVTKKDVYMKACLDKAGLKEYPKSLAFMGKQNAEFISDIMINSDIYCMVSHIENSPNTLCEAMLVGMPIIASTSGGTSSIIEDKIEGRIIQDGDSYSLAGMIIHYYNNFNLVKEYACNAHKRAIRRHNPENIVNELIKSYQQIIEYGNE